MSAHTPGPWEVMRHGPQEWAINAPKGDPRIGYSSWECLAVCYGSDDFKDVGEEVGSANARLIAAAPELLAVLKFMVDWHAKRDENDEFLPIESQEAEVLAAMQAIAKAEGRA